jgi:hypothetical protein
MPYQQLRHRSVIKVTLRSERRPVAPMVVDRTGLQVAALAVRLRRRVCADLGEN